jgi:hypothetical protein
MTAICTADYKWWPYDTVSCEFAIGAFPESDADVTFKLIPKLLTNTSRRMTNNEWDLIGAEKQMETTMSGAKNYTSLAFTYKFKRHSGEQVVMFLTPVFGM